MPLLAPAPHRPTKPSFLTFRINTVWAITAGHANSHLAEVLAALRSLASSGFRAAVYCEQMYRRAIEWEKPMPMILKEKPIFMLGAERSGTTLVMAMLGCHPRIAVPEV